MSWGIFSFVFQGSQQTQIATSTVRLPDRTAENSKTTVVVPPTPVIKKTVEKVSPPASVQSPPTTVQVPQSPQQAEYTAHNPYEGLVEIYGPNGQTSYVVPGASIGPGWSFNPLSGSQNCSVKYANSIWDGTYNNDGSSHCACPSGYGVSNDGMSCQVMQQNYAQQPVYPVKSTACQMAEQSVQQKQQEIILVQSSPNIAAEIARGRAQAMQSTLNSLIINMQIACQ